MVSSAIIMRIEDHERAVKDYWQRLVEAGCIREGKHAGYYSVNEESFISEKDLVKDETVDPPQFKTEAGEKLELIQEKNYVFEITPEIREAIRKWVGEGTVVP